MKVRQVAGRVSFRRISLVADVARLGGAGDARLLAEVFRSVQAARVGRLDGEVEGGVDEGREAALRPAAVVVARPLTGVIGPCRRRVLADGHRQQTPQHADDEKPTHTSEKRTSTAGTALSASDATGNSNDAPAELRRSAPLPEISLQLYRKPRPNTAIPTRPAANYSTNPRLALHSPVTAAAAAARLHSSPQQRSRSSSHCRAIACSHATSATKRMSQ